MIENSTDKSTNIPLLETKLFVPGWRAGMVSRPRLVDRMNQGLERKLTLVSAPAGFGKTTLAVEWLSGLGEGRRRTGWVSLDQSDSEPILFWVYFIAALQKVHADLGREALALLRSSQPPPIESILTTLINEINAIGEDLVLILDDYHLIDAPAIHAALEFFLEHMPPRMHLLIASRCDPPLPLARLRARGDSLEFRAADLSFRADEAAAFLNDVMDLRLAPAEVEALEKRTEGWIAGLQLAALSMQGRENLPGFVADFAGDDRYIVDYLVEEVLRRQSGRVRDFLLQTSILDRLSGPLCEAVTGLADSRNILEMLERDNLFVIPLDDKRRWYRYHHLFGDVLRAYFHEEQADKVGLCHRRASEWYDANASALEAIRHAIAAEDYPMAARQIELAAPALFAETLGNTLYAWLKRLPEDIVRARPVLCVWSAWSYLDESHFEAADARLGIAEAWLAAGAVPGKATETAGPAMIVADETQIPALPGIIAAARSFYTQALGDMRASERFARQALEQLPEDSLVWRGGATAILGLATWTSGDLETAYRYFLNGLELIRQTGNSHCHITGTHVLADVRVAQGRLREACEIYRQSLRYTREWRGLVIRGTADLHLGLCELYREFDDLLAATEQLQQGRRLGEMAALTENRYRWCLAEGLLEESKGNTQAALEKIEEAERVFVRDAVPHVRPLAALKVRLWLAQNRLQDALDWARKHKLSADDELSYIREFEHLTLARVLIARYRSEGKDKSIMEALRLLEGLAQSAAEARRGASMIGIRILQALACDARGDLARALQHLQVALVSAEPEGYVRIFADEGPAMRKLLRDALATGMAQSYTRRLLSAFDGSARVDSGAATAARKNTNGSAVLPEHLTLREREILRLIAAGIKNQDIADQLFISLHTVKRHIANAYGKLGVSERREAVARASELGLL